MRSLVSGVVEIAGASALVVGAAQISSAAGWIVAGSLALVAAWRANQ